MVAAKEEFLRDFREDYGYPGAPKNIDQIRATEFKRLDGLVYLDHAGATLYSESQMRSICEELTTCVYGNPHSQSDTSSSTCEIIREARELVLCYCNASLKDYKCIFTSGATAALKMVGEAFPWTHQSCFVYTMENHNSVLGMREYALDKGAMVIAVDIEEGEVNGNVKILQHQMQRRKGGEVRGEKQKGEVYNLFAFPSECNFSGMRYRLDLVNVIQEDSRRVFEGTSFSNGNNKWMVLIDAAKGASTRPPDLSRYPADFVVVSFYKLFGYPTGLGALIVRNNAAKLLKKKYFSGGTVATSIADIDHVKRREGVEEWLEDGTASFLSIASVRHGFKILNMLTVPAISRHTASLAMYMRKMLLELRHGNGANACTLYGSHCSKVFDKMGPIVSFNLKRPDGSWVGYREVEKLASLSGIQLRTGCFCNPGACAKLLGLSHSDILSNSEAGHVCWDDQDIIRGKPTGAVRVSFGYMSTYEDAKKFIDFVKKCFVSVTSHSENGNHLKFIERGIIGSSYYLKSITVYPIKSCGGFSVESWPIGQNGLRHDREWVLRSLTGEILTQKKVPDMYRISTYIDLNKEILFTESPSCETRLQIKLKSNDIHGREEIDLQGQRYHVRGYDDEVNTWFSCAIGRPCMLLRHSSCDHDVTLQNSNVVVKCRDAQGTLNFSNEAQFLLVSEESLSDLNNRLSTNMQDDNRVEAVEINPMRFRPNLVICGGKPYDEDGWEGLRIGGNSFISLGGCNRCQMINFSLDDTGQVLKSKEPLATLASYRRVKGKISFGILLTVESEVRHNSNCRLQVGQELFPGPL